MGPDHPIPAHRPSRRRETLSRRDGFFITCFERGDGILKKPHRKLSGFWRDRPKEEGETSPVIEFIRGRFGKAVRALPDPSMRGGEDRGSCLEEGAVSEPAHP